MSHCRTLALLLLIPRVIRYCEGASTRSRLKLTGLPGNIDFCLEVNAYGNRSEALPPNVRKEGQVVDIWQCKLVERYHDYANRDIVDLWQVEEGGLIYSGVSDMCVFASQVGTQQLPCTSSSQKWNLDSGFLHLASDPTHCLGPDDAIVDKNTTFGYSLRLLPCEIINPELIWQVDIATLVVYPIPNAGYAPYGSSAYQVYVSQGEHSHESYVYTDSGDGGSNSYTTFSFSGSVKVLVRSLQGPFTNVVVRPLSLGLVPVKIFDDTVQIEIPTPNVKLSIEFDDLWKATPLLLFADELEADVPDRFSQNLLYYGIGEHNVNQVLQSNQLVYIAGGAFVVSATASVHNIFGSSTDSSSVRNIKIRGRGVISGKLSLGFPYMISLCGSYHEVSGVTIVEAPQQSNLQINAPWSCSGKWSGKAVGARIDNVKILGWRFADGIYAGAKSHVSNVFTKVNDDGVKPFEGDSLFENNVHWQMKNGWAIMISWITSGVQTNITVRNSVVVHDEHDHDWSVPGCNPCRESQAVMGIVHGGSGTVQDVTLENITMETKVWRPLWFGVEKNQWAKSGAGQIHQLKLNNIKVLGGALHHSEIVGLVNTNQVSNIAVTGFMLGDKVATSAQDAQMDIYDATDIRFTAAAERQVSDDHLHQTERLIIST